MKYSFKQITILLLLFLLACERTKTSDCASIEEGRGHIVSVLSFGKIGADYLSDFLKNNNIDIGVVPVTDVKVYSIVYETVDWNGEPHLASGAIYVPDEDHAGKNYPIYSGQHGTEAKRTNVASVTPLRGFDAMFIASIGYIGSSPDLLGLGVSNDVVHPYINAFSAEAVVDKIRATKNWLCANDINENGQLFLAGYSEGGYVAMATHKLVEEKHADEFIITASAPMAGPYDMRYSSTSLLSRKLYPEPGYLSFIYMAYNEIEGMDRPASDFFRSPYAEKIPSLMDGSKTIDEANKELTTTIKNLFTEKFLTDFLGNGEQELKSAFDKNSLVSWSPKAPIKLFHGENDITVGYQNAVIARDSLKANGADVELITIPGGTHRSSVFISYASAVAWFNTFKK
jgi:pimeloyl-ACP methyl ester carboxylesterase